MHLLIDGYNVLHAVGLLGGGVGPGGLRRAREALLGVLAASLEPKQRAATTVVFDAHHAPPDVPATVRYRGLTVRYAVGYPDADTLIEELIRRESAPKQLTVVSSDQQIRRAARRRKAVSLGAEAWYEQLLARREAARKQAKPQDGPSASPPVVLSAEEVDFWVDEFGGEAECNLSAETGPSRGADPEPPEGTSDDEPPGRKPSDDQLEELHNPFPPGYGEDLLDAE